MKKYYVYIIASRTNGTLYIGITNNIKRRVEEHRSGLIPGFTNRYKTTILVYLEDTESARDAIAREKQLKNWHRLWKLNLINQTNPNWEDLSNDL
jgi:putative endonuclease